MVAVGPQTMKKPKLITLDTINPEEVKWLWYPYIPIGAVTVIYGQGGVGKSHITCDIAARITRGLSMPGRDDGKSKPQKVLMLSAEDDYGKVLVPRLIRAEADLSMIGVPDDQFVLDSRGIKLVEEFMRDFAVTVVFIDPIVYYAGGKMDINRSNEVRDMMKKLFDAAAQADTAVIVVGHTRKSQEGNLQDGMMGSADWINAARSGLVVRKTNDGTRVMQHAKANWGPMGNAQSFELAEDGFRWTGEVDDDVLISQSKAGRPNDKLRAAQTFIKAALANGEIESTEFLSMAKDEGITPATLNRAKTDVAESYFSTSKKKFFWRLLSDALEIAEEQLP